MECVSTHSIIVPKLASLMLRRNSPSPQMRSQFTLITRRLYTLLSAKSAGAAGIIEFPWPRLPKDEFSNHECLNGSKRFRLESHLSMRQPSESVCRLGAAQLQRVMSRQIGLARIAKGHSCAVRRGRIMRACCLRAMFNMPVTHELGAAVAAFYLNLHGAPCVYVYQLEPPSR